MSDNLQPLLASLICDPSDSVALTQLLTRCLRGDPAFNDYLHHEDATLRQALTALFAQPSTPVDNLTQLAVTQVRLSHQLDQERPIDLNMLSALAADELCLLVLGESLNTDLAFEHVCVRLRRACLNDPQLAVAVQPLLAALALQAWTNEYIWQESDEETREVERSRTDIEAALDRGEVAAAALPLLLWSMYRPLTSLRFAEKLAAFPLDSLPAVLHRLWRVTLLAAYEEAALRASLPSFASITDDTSRAVRAQYEDNPYPRWRRLRQPELSVLERNRLHDPLFSWPPHFREPLQILVAGGGTGRHPLTVAAANPNAEVLALDLSRNSLAYGARMARELGIYNIHFMHGDLFNLPQLGRTFHHLECVGVLPALKEQKAAWQSLISVLEPGGTFYVGVYSTVARLAVTHLRKRIAREGVLSTPVGMRSFRAQMMHESGSAAISQFYGRRAFYSLSDFRDLLFHVQEHQHTLSELEERAVECGLRFLGGFLPARLQNELGWHARPRTFKEWRALEKDYVGLAGMFFCTLYRPPTESS